MSESTDGRLVVAHAPECSGRVYGCCCCDAPWMTISESWRHQERHHPETIQRQVVDADRNITWVPKYPELQHGR